MIEACPATNRARKYLAAMPAAVEGQRGHNATFAAACALVRFGITQGDAWALLCEYNARCSPPWSEGELRHKLTSAFATAHPDPRFAIDAPQPARRANVPSFMRAPVPLRKVAFDESKLATFAARGPHPKSWRHWLWERSPKRPETQGPLAFLKCLFKPGEIVLAFDSMGGPRGKNPAWMIQIADPDDCRAPEEMRDGGTGQGVWFLCNPVDGKWHQTPDGKSCRSKEAVTAFRFAVLESDAAPPHLWLAAIAQMPIRIAAIYSSGGRSLHALVRIDAASKPEWDSIVAPLKRPLAVLGADPAALTAVRLTRLPGCWRPEKRGFQKLLFLNPEPPDVPLVDLPVRLTRRESLDRWKQLCPRWTGKEAFA
jgi:hypothetical protein